MTARPPSLPARAGEAEEADAGCARETGGAPVKGGGKAAHEVQGEGDVMRLSVSGRAALSMCPNALP